MTVFLLWFKIEIRITSLSNMCITKEKKYQNKQKHRPEKSYKTQMILKLKSQRLFEEEGQIFEMESKRTMRTSNRRKMLLKNNLNPSKKRKRLSWNHQLGEIKIFHHNILHKSSPKSQRGKTVTTNTRLLRLGIKRHSWAVSSLKAMLKKSVRIFRTNKTLIQWVSRHGKVSKFRFNLNSKLLRWASLRPNP